MCTINGRGISPKTLTNWIYLVDTYGFLKMIRHKRLKRKNKLIQRSSIIEIKHLFHKLNLDTAFKCICLEKPKEKNNTDLVDDSEEINYSAAETKNLEI